MTFQDLMALLAAAGGGAILPEITKRALDAISGKGKKRRNEVDKAWRARDREATTRRRLEEYASLLIRLLTAATCVDPKDIPKWPAYSTTDTDADTKGTD